MLFLDLDDTLLSSDMSISETNLEAIKKASDAGANIVICTGRGIFSVKHIAQKLGVDNGYIICLNGGAVYKGFPLSLIHIFLVEDGAVTGVMTSSQAEYRAKAVVLCMGTYMKARCLYGETIVHSGPNGLMPATELSKSLLDLGITLYRFKTGTPARIDGNTIDFSKMTPQYGDENIVPFSFENTPEEIKREQVPCYLAYTNADTHNLIRENLHRSAMYGGLIHGTGPRYLSLIHIF